VSELPPEPPPEEPYSLPGTQAAWEPGDFPDAPMTAADAACFQQKVIA
jgi:hypothetical protein